MLNYIESKIDWDKDLPDRSRMIELYTRVYRGKIYDHLKNYFFQERDMAGNYIPMHMRQPSVKPNFCKLIVDDSVSLLFGSDHFPKINCKDKGTRQALEDIITQYKINNLMLRAATIGATGSVCIFVRIVESVLKLEAKNTKYLTPQFDSKYPDRLSKLTERYKVKGSVLIASGYTKLQIKELNSLYWFHREFDSENETYYFPYLCSDEKPKLKVDQQRSHQHKLGFVPAVWIKNLPDIVDTDENGAVVDGLPTFSSDAIDTQIEAHYQLSQAGRALKYAGDPLLILKLSDDQSTLQANSTSTAESGQQPQVARTASNAMVLTPEDEAKLLEISGEGTRATLEYVRACREYLMETLRGNRSNADKVNIAQSGSAMKALNQALIWLTDHLRLSYGDSGLIRLLEMIVEITNIPGFSIIVNNKRVEKLNKNSPITLAWPSWYPNTPADNVQEAGAIKTLSDGGFISKETGTKSIAANYSIEDIEHERKLIKQDQAVVNDLNPKVTEVESI